jgi:hypothetical protein
MCLRSQNESGKIGAIDHSQGSTLVVVQSVGGIAVGIAPAVVELGKEALPTFEPLGSGCRIRKGEQRHDDC